MSIIWGCRTTRVSGISPTTDSGLIECA
jgi:hypothetical protein